MAQSITRPKAYLKARHTIVRDALDNLKLDALLLTHASDLSYLTDFTGDDSIGLITGDSLHVVTDFRYQEQVSLEAGWVKLAIRDENMARTLAETLAGAGLEKVGFEANFCTVGQIAALEKALKELKKPAKVTLVPVEDVMSHIRMIKDDHEIDLVRRSVAVAEEAYEAVREEIKPGLTENHIAGLLISELRSRGAMQASFEPIVAAGANSSLPHYRPGEQTIKKDQPLLIDWGAVVRGYCSDLTRTLLIGRVSQKIRDAYKVVHLAQKTAIEFLRPGVTSIQADQVARDVIEKAGFGKYFGHGLGHGIGRDIHEMPSLRKNGSEQELRPGMIVTVEPGVYLPGIGGVRIEDDVLITHGGSEVLSSLDRSLEGSQVG